MGRSFVPITSDDGRIHEMKWIKLPLFFGAAGLFMFSAMPALSPALGVTQFGGIHT